MSKEAFTNNESIEMYLETIYRLHLENPNVRMSDVASALGVTKPSTHTAMSVLKKQGMIEQQRYGDIHLTPEGIEKGKSIFYRHQLLTRFLQQTLDLDEQVAENDACRIEHVLSETTIKAIESKLSH